MSDCRDNSPPLPTADDPAFSPKTCSRCGTKFGCGGVTADAGTFRCWCQAFPALTEVDPSAGCLCPVCLSASVSDQKSPPMPAPSPAERPRICSFESRRAIEMEKMIAKQGGIPTVAPSMRELPIEETADVQRFAAQLREGEVDWILFMTGVGAEALLGAWETFAPREEFFEHLERLTVMVRGPKPTAVLRKWKVRIDHTAPEPNTWREVLDVIDANSPEDASIVNGKRFAVQEYGRPNSEFYAELNKRGASVVPVPVYRWALPEDTGPLAEAIRDTIAGQFDWLLFTSAKQVEHVLEIAERDGHRDEWLAAANRTRVASIGPTCTEALIEYGLPVTTEASPPKMGQLIKTVFNHAEQS